MSLLKNINDTVTLQEHEVNTISANVDLLSENIDENFGFITEAITQWLAKVGKVVGGGRLDPEKAKSVAEILGAISALGNPDTAAAFDEKGDLGTVLYMASSANPQESNAALKRLREIGRHESARTYTQQATQAMQDPTAFTDYVNKTKTDIDRVMRTKLAKEKGATQQQAPAAQQQSPVQTAPGVTT